MAKEPAFDKGLEAIIAEMLRVHLVGAVFSRDAVRNGLPPERVEALRREIVDRLKQAEDTGREHRETVRVVVDAALGIVPGGATAASVVQSVLERLVSKKSGTDPDGDASHQSDSTNEADSPTEAEDR